MPREPPPIHGIFFALLKEIFALASGDDVRLSVVIDHGRPAGRYEEVT